MLFQHSKLVNTPPVYKGCGGGVSYLDGESLMSILADLSLRLDGSTGSGLIELATEEGEDCMGG